MHQTIQLSTRLFVSLCFPIHAAFSKARHFECWRRTPRSGVKVSRSPLRSHDMAVGSGVIMGGLYNTPWRQTNCCEIFGNYILPWNVLQTWDPRWFDSIFETFWRSFWKDRPFFQHENLGWPWQIGHNKLATSIAMDPLIHSTNIQTHTTNRFLEIASETFPIFIIYI